MSFANCMETNAGNASAVSCLPTSYCGWFKSAARFISIVKQY